MKFVGAPFTFGFEQVGTNCGLIGKNAAIEIDGVAYWMGNNGFFSFDGTVNTLPCSVEDFVYDDSDEDTEDLDICHYCHNEMLLEQNTGKIICVTCGIQEQVLIDSDKPSYKDPPKEMTSFCYKRINHLNEFLAQFQAKETTEIPEEVYNEILVEINKEKSQIVFENVNPSFSQD